MKDKEDKEVNKLLELTLKIAAMKILTITTPKNWADTLIPVNCITFPLQIPKELEEFASEENNHIALQLVVCEGIVRYLTQEAKRIDTNPKEKLEELIEVLSLRQATIQ